MESYRPVVDIYRFDIDTAPYEELERIHSLCFTDSWNTDTLEAMLTVYGTYGIAIGIDQEIQGFVLYRQPFNDAEVLTICVNPKMENKGNGTLLIQHMLKHLNKTGKCFLEVSPKNTYAVKLYKKFNFSIIHTRKNYYAKGEDAYVMMREI